MANEIIKQLTVGLSEILVYSTIALVFIFGIVKCIYPVYRNSVLLNRAVMKLERTTGSKKKPVWQEPRFLGRALRPEWQRFLLNADQLELRGLPCNTEEYVNEDTVVFKPGHGQVAEILPSLLTSLGILGTFLGMMEGLTNMNFTDSTTTISSIPTLLGGMRFAFATSVVGITCSIIFNVVYHIAKGHAFKALDAFDETFYELAMPRPLDSDVQMIIQKQDEDMGMQQTIGQLGGQIAGAVELAVSRATHPLTMSMDNFIQGTTHEQIDGIQRIVNRFVQQMDASMNGQFSALADAMNRMHQSMAETQQSLNYTIETAKELAIDRQMVDAGSKDRKDLERLLSQNEEMMAKLIQSIEGMQVSFEMAMGKADKQGRQRPDKELGVKMDELTASMDKMSEAVNMLHMRLGFQENNTRGADYSGGQQA
ncbi:MAG TPA: MotA/TolQ/ExbB proton channel family protein [Candidatus Limiplasma sp.]|nr:MotA/TolQ/ExbB proton channel family protein [Candidatus Limiplasma sp.]